MHAISSECETDRVNDDVTVHLLGEKQWVPSIAVLRAKEPGVFSGLEVVETFAALYEGQITVRCDLANGSTLKTAQEILRMEGTAGQCLSLERTLINYLSHLSGIATLTSKFVSAVKPYPVKILATRKTLPGLRDLQLRAVVSGGGHVHRRNLSDGILIKENHQMFCDPKTLLSRSQDHRSPLHRVEIEVQDFKALTAVLENAPDVIMLDNFSDEELPVAIRQIRDVSKLCRIEVSGGMTLERVSKIAGLGMDYISVGQLTHSSPSLNMSMDLEKK